MSSTDRIAYFYDSEIFHMYLLICVGDMGNYYYAPGHPMKPQRLRLTHNLLLTYNLYRYLEVYRPHQATEEEMEVFHTKEYVDFLSHITPNNMKEYQAEMEQFAVPSGVDNPVFDGIFNYCRLYCGASLDAASRLNQGRNQICVNWSGGLHHAKKAEASGFCYMNDIVLAILELLKVFPRVMYIDIDIHHGDGVEEAFYCTDRVMTVSFHKYGNYFPGTGSIDDIGINEGRNFAVNVPLKDGMDDESYQYVFDPIVTACVKHFQPSAIVLQCGADSITGDRLGTFNMSLHGHAHCVDFVRNLHIPLLVLGGGGYTIKNVSRAWSYETSVLLNKEISNEIPYNNYIEWYAPTYQLHLVPLPTLVNQNSRDYLDSMIQQVTDRLKELESVPSVQLKRMPEIWNKEVKEEDIDESKNGMDAIVQKEGEFYEDERDIDHDSIV
ncbi:histone deacetylase [Blastocystis sp. subtype 4]|uniref:histone deacetylase n=1 Tax=Blastocystis sp. subtype 4 TaxID=944170 RepID=UPI0007119BDA|nr:histone deacetylase [Blastocystis sp. subtype 4]KNB44440.1 histone deacetylase [Blastocystis sp. subtype 4]|eukprot:XP_014527876.1 histone deacetylase [Blastocystis sp. subtype 4]